MNPLKCLQYVGIVPKTYHTMSINQDTITKKLCQNSNQVRKISLLTKKPGSTDHFWKMLTKNLSSFFRPHFKKQQVCAFSNYRSPVSSKYGLTSTKRTQPSVRCKRAPQNDCGASMAKFVS